MSSSRHSHNTVMYTLTPEPAAESLLATPAERGGFEVWRHYDTDIVSRNLSTRAVTLNSGGFRTFTTKGKINDILSALHLPFQLYTDRRVWWLWTTTNESKKWVFVDGITIHDSLSVTGSLDSEVFLRRKRALEGRIKKYLERARKKLDREWPEPGPGDCWYCGMTEVETGKSWGDVSGNHDHLFSHMQDGYVPGMLLVRAIQDTGRRPEVWFPMLRQDKERGVREMITLLGKYLRGKLIPTIR